VFFPLALSEREDGRAELDGIQWWTFAAGRKGGGGSVSRPNVVA
jgi:hypothetical protein